MKKQTAVEWLIKEFNLESYKTSIRFALQMEKEQIISAWISGENDGSLEPKAFVEMAEQYYNETYNQK